jgi:hypothetical protein
MFSHMRTVKDCSINSVEKAQREQGKTYTVFDLFFTSACPIIPDIWYDMPINDGSTRPG